MKKISGSERRYDEVYLEEEERYRRLDEEIQEEMFGVRRQKPTQPKDNQNGSDEQGSAPEAANPNGESAANPDGEGATGPAAVQAPAPAGPAY